MLPTLPYVTWQSLSSALQMIVNLDKNGPPVRRPNKWTKAQVDNVNIRELDNVPASAVVGEVNVDANQHHSDMDSVPEDSANGPIKWRLLADQFASVPGYRVANFISAGAKNNPFRHTFQALVEAVQINNGHVSHLYVSIILSELLDLTMIESLQALRSLTRPASADTSKLLQDAGNPLPSG